MIMLTLFLNVIFAIVLTITLTSTPASSVLAVGVSEPFEDMAANWIIGTDVNGTGTTVTRSNTQKYAGTYSAAAFTTNSNSKAQVRDVISSNWSNVPSTNPGAFVWQRAYVYV